MVKILLINIRIYLNININKQTNFEYDFWAKVKALIHTGSSVMDTGVVLVLLYKLVVVL